MLNGFSVIEFSQIIDHKTINGHMIAVKRTDIKKNAGDVMQSNADQAHKHN